MSAGLGLLQILGSGGEGYFGAKSDNIRGETKKKEESRKEKALALREANLAKIRSMYKTEELGTASRLSAANQKESDARKEDAAKSKFKREQGAPTDDQKEYELLLEAYGGDKTLANEAWISKKFGTDTDKNAKKNKVDAIAKAHKILDEGGSLSVANQILTTAGVSKWVEVPTGEKGDRSGFLWLKEGKDEVMLVPEDSLKKGILGGTDTSASAGGGEAVVTKPEDGEPEAGGAVDYDDLKKEGMKSLEDVKDIINNTDESVSKAGVGLSAETPTSSPGLLEPPVPEEDKAKFNSIMQDIMYKNPKLPLEEAKEQAIEQYRKWAAERDKRASEQAERAGQIGSDLPIGNRGTETDYYNKLFQGK